MVWNWEEEWVWLSYMKKQSPEVCPCVQSLPPACYWEFRAWWNSFLFFSEHLLSSLHYSCVYFILLEELKPDKGLPNFFHEGPDINSKYHKLCGYTVAILLFSFARVTWEEDFPWTEEPGRLQSMGSQRVGHKWGRHKQYINTRVFCFLIILHFKSKQS